MHPENSSNKKPGEWDEQNHEEVSYLNVLSHCLMTAKK